MPSNKICRTPACSIIIPTRDRAAILERTLSRLVALPDERVEIIVIDNGSLEMTANLRARFTQVRWVLLGENLGAAARNVGAMAAAGRVLLMLDDDSWPEPGVISRLVRRFDEQPKLGAVACRVRLADSPNRHDAGGVPGVFFNCGGAVRRSAFLAAGGYPIDYDYYVEEYALCCELWQGGWTVELGGAEVVWHQRSHVNRDANRMLRYLVRNNVRLWNRYAPEGIRRDVIDFDLSRYRRIADRENAVTGYESGLYDANQTTSIGSQRFESRRLTDAQFESMMGLDSMRQLLRRAVEADNIRTVVIWMRGKGCEFVVDAAISSGLRVVGVYDAHLAHESEPRQWRGWPLYHANSQSPIDADAVLLGTLSPGVAEDLECQLEKTHPALRIINPAPWNAADASIGDQQLATSRVA